MPALLVKARGFMTRVTDQIVDVPVSSTPSQSQSQNLAKVTSLGGELSLQYEITKLGSVFANGTVIRSRGTNDCATEDCLDTRDNAVPFVPAWTSNAGATLRLPARITVSPYVNVVGTYYDSASTKGRKAFGKDPVFSLKATKTFLAPTHAVDLSLVLNNLANHKYDLPWQFRDPGFNAMAYVDLRI
jgi:iron complex outermembrane recepter protein